MSKKETLELDIFRYAGCIISCSTAYSAFSVEDWQSTIVETIASLLSAPRVAPAIAVSSEETGVHVLSRVTLPASPGGSVLALVPGAKLTIAKTQFDLLSKASNPDTTKGAMASLIVFSVCVFDRLMQEAKRFAHSRIQKTTKGCFRDTSFPLPVNEHAPLTPPSSPPAPPSPARGWRVPRPCQGG